MSDDQQRRAFSAEFKRESADLMLKQHDSFIKASRLFDIGDIGNPSLGRSASVDAHWGHLKEQGADSRAEKIEELEARIDRLESEKSILKKLPRP